MQITIIRALPVLVTVLTGSAFAAPCDINLTTEQEALACLNWRIKNNNLASLAENSGHTGDLSKCTTYTSNDVHGSYFSSDKVDDTITKTTADSCIQRTKKWDCWGTTTGTQGCFIQPGGIQKGQLTSRIYFSIGDGTISTKVITLYPTKP